MWKILETARGQIYLHNNVFDEDLRNLFKHHLKVLLITRERKYAAECGARIGYFAFRDIALLNFHAKDLHTIHFNYHLVA